MIFLKIGHCVFCMHLTGSMNEKGPLKSQKIVENNDSEWLFLPPRTHSCFSWHRTLMLALPPQHVGCRWALDKLRDGVRHRPKPASMAHMPGPGWLTKEMGPDPTRDKRDTSCNSGTKICKLFLHNNLKTRPQKVNNCCWSWGRTSWGQSWPG